MCGQSRCVCASLCVCEPFLVYAPVLVCMPIWTCMCVHLCVCAHLYLPVCLSVCASHSLHTRLSCAHLSRHTWRRKWENICFLSYLLPALPALSAALQCRTSSWHSILCVCVCVSSSSRISINFHLSAAQLVLLACLLSAQTEAKKAGIKWEADSRTEKETDRYTVGKTGRKTGR